MLGRLPACRSVLRLALALLLGTGAAPAFAAGGHFLFVTFKGEATPLTEQIYFATSEDGRTWTALNHGEPVLVSDLGEKGVRDPYLLRDADGRTFHLIATDLSINLHPDWKRAVEAGSRSLVIWDSTDLVHWSKPRLVPVAPADAGCTWAPEAVYDETAGDYLVFWASTTASDHFAKHRIWAARTKDFTRFSAPFVYLDRPTAVIDATIVRHGSSYVRFTKDEKFKAIAMEVSDRLLGPWREVPAFSLAHLRGVEGPECYLVSPASAGAPATWCLILDAYQTHQGYQPYVAHDLASGRFKPGAGFTFPFPFRHGSVLPVSAEEFARLQAAFARSSGEKP